MNIRPLANNVLVRLEDVPEDVKQLIYTVRLEKEPQAIGIVEAVGLDVLDVQVGQRVLISRLQGLMVGPSSIIVPESAVLAYL